MKRETHACSHVYFFVCFWYGYFSQIFNFHRLYCTIGIRQKYIYKQFYSIKVAKSKFVLHFCFIFLIKTSTKYMKTVDLSLKVEIFTSLFRWGNKVVVDGKEGYYKWRHQSIILCLQKNLQHLECAHKDILTGQVQQ